MTVGSLPPPCPICGKPRKAYQRTHLSKTCGNRACSTALTQRTNLERHGHISNLHSTSGKAQVQKSLKDRYGENISNVSQISEVKIKKVETCRKNFGVDYPMQSEEVMEKSKAAIQALYGVDNVSKNAAVIAKIIERQRLVLDDTLKARKATHQTRYGVDWYTQSADFKKKVTAIILKRYGADNIRKTKYFHDLMVEKGRWYSDDDIKKLLDYRRVVSKYTRRSLVKYGHLLCRDPEVSDLQVDHIYSVSEGFKKNLSPEIVGCIVNLQLLPAEQNTSKGSDCWITKEELFSLYETYKRETGGSV